MSEETITLKKDMLWKGAVVVLAILFVISLFTGGFGGGLGNSNQPSINTGDAAGQQPQAVAPVPVSIDDDAILGDKDASVTIIEFSDYQCPFCRKFWTETMPQLKKNYIDTGKVRFVYRDFPLGFHPNAGPAAEAAECAREVGGSDEAYYKMHDKIFQEQNKLDGGDPNTGPVQSTVSEGWDLKKWAKDLGYDIGSCLDSGKYTDEVQNDESDGQASGVQGTPGFFINGQPLSGAQPYSVFKQMIDVELG